MALIDIVGFLGGATCRHLHRYTGKPHLPLALAVHNLPGTALFQRSPATPRKLFKIYIQLITVQRRIIPYITLPCPIMTNRV